MAIINDLWNMFGNKDESNIKKTVKATVLRMDEDGRIWVHVEGGVDETPIYSTTASVVAGDVVNVRIEGGKAYIDGSTSAPSVSVAQVTKVVQPIADGIESVKSSVGVAKEASEASKRAAEEARSAATATGQHFWHREEDTQSDGAGTGAFVTDETKDDFLEAAASGFPSKSDSKPYHNLLMNSLGIMLRTALNNLVSITQSSIAFFDGLGNQAANVVASFGKDGSKIGLDNESHVEIDYHSMQMIDREGHVYMHVSDLRDETGIVTMVDEFTGDGVTKYFGLTLPAMTTDYDVTYTMTDQPTYTKHDTHVWFSVPPAKLERITVTYQSNYFGAKAYTFGMRGYGARIGPLSFAEGESIIATGAASHAEGYTTHAGGHYSHAENYNTRAIGDDSHAEGALTTASGNASHAEGRNTEALGKQSHAEGNYTKASNDYAHAEGYYTTASGYSSHAEGYYTTASGYCSHAEGFYLTASGYCSHAQNGYTIAASDYQTAIGKYNVEDANGTYALIIGNGTSDNSHSNALTVSWNGRTWMGRALVLRADAFTGQGNDNFVGLYAQTKKRGGWAFRVFGSSADEWGDAVVIGDGGMFIAGAGESAESLYNTLVAAGTGLGDENAYLTADSDVHIVPSCNTIANRIDYLFNANGLIMRQKSIYDLNSIEMKPPANNSNHGGYIDFHYNQSTADYTSRIWEDAEGRLTVLQGVGSFRKFADGTYNGFHVIAKNQSNHETVSSQTDSGGYYIYDKNGNIEGRLFHRHYTDGRCMFYMETHRIINNTNYWNSISVGLDSSGNQVYTVSNPAAFRSAIGAQAAGSYFPTSGGTITGSVRVHASEINLSADVSTAVNPSSDVIRTYGIKAMNNNAWFGFIQAAYTKTGTSNVVFGSRTKNSSGTDVTASITMGANRNGTIAYSVSNAAAFRSGIGAAASSDRRLKSDISILGEDAVAFIDALEPCVYTINGERQVGLIAQDVYEADTWGTRMAFETVEGIDGLDDWEKMDDGSPTWKLDYIRIIPPLVATVKSQARRIEELEDKVSRFEKLVASIMES